MWETEWAPFGLGRWDPAWDDGSPSSGFTWAQDIYTGLTAANLGAFLYLWGANTSTTTVTGPNTGLVDVQGNTLATSPARILGRSGVVTELQSGPAAGPRHGTAAGGSAA